MNEAATWETAASPPGLGVRQALLGAQAGTGQVQLSREMFCAGSEWPSPVPIFRHPFLHKMGFGCSLCLPGGVICRIFLMSLMIRFACVHLHQFTHPVYYHVVRNLEHMPTKILHV